MKTKQIPFSLEMVKKIQAGEIKGSIKTRDGKAARFLGEIKHHEFPLVFVRKSKHNDEELLETYTITGKFYIGFNRNHNDIILEIEDEEKKPEYQFKPFDKVMCRDYDDDVWKAVLFSHRVCGLSYPYYACGGTYYKQCIPYIGNEHLLGTTDKPKEE